MAITNQLEIVQPWESLSVCFLTPHNLEVFKHLCQSANVWHCGNIVKGKFYNPNSPTFTAGNWSIISTEVWGLIDLHCQEHLFCFMVDEINESHPCPVNLNGDAAKVNQRLCEWLKRLIEEA
ncbi:MAG TPA: hypothetical protein V6D19_05485 [Stenomitos sp.]